MSRKLQHVSLNLKDKEMIKSIFILMQLKNIPSPGTSKQGQGVTEWVRDQTNMGRLCEEKKWRIWCSSQISPEDVNFPQPIIPAPHNPTIPPLLPNVQPLESYPQPWKGVDLGRTEKLQMEGVSQSVTDSSELWSDQRQDWRWLPLRLSLQLLNLCGLLHPRKPSFLH